MDARATFWSALICCTLVGCGGGSTPAATAEDPPDEASFKPLPLKSVDEAKLPKLGDYLRNIDNKVEIAPPQGWLPKGRSKEYLTAFVKEKSAAVPAILVKAADATLGDFTEVTADNVIDYAITVQGTLSDPIESARPMQIGKHHFARYVKEARIANLPAEVQVLSTVREGRTYTIELRVRDVEDLKKYRDQAYAVAAGLKFAADAKPFDFKPQIEPAETKPAEAPPADAKPGEPAPPAAK
jgi:hypothetical protein